jgi:hypothetical protein
VGRFDDDYESAAWVAHVEAEHAHRIFDRGGVDATNGGGRPIDGTLAAAIRYVDFGAAPIDPRFAAHPDAPATTRPARLGVSMALGTAEGPGPLYGTPWIPRLCNGLVHLVDLARGVLGTRQHDPVWPMLELDRGLDGRLMGLLGLRSPLLMPVDPITRYVRHLIENDALNETPWIPQIVPCQIVRLGPLAIAAVPFEPTTVAGRRLRQTLLEVLAPAGVEAVVINPYANAYAGYLTTFEEYQVQHYEAGYTVFGPWELAAVRTAFAGVARALAGKGNGAGADASPGAGGRRSDSPVRGPRPLRVPAELVERQAYTRPWPAFGSPT